tara:strand:+ start:1027 stop:1227 length:201 start_codon:yes stop_codon:yes gene_type:complete
VGKKNKQYFKYSDGTSVSLRNLTLVKWLDEQSNVNSEPVEDHIQAEIKCHSYLQKGICAWMVHYDG